MLCVVPAAFSQIYFTRRALVLISPFLSLFLCPNQNPLFPLPPSLSIFFPNLPFTNHVPSSSSHAAAATATSTSAIFKGLGEDMIYGTCFTASKSLSFRALLLRKSLNFQVKFSSQCFPTQIRMDGNLNCNVEGTRKESRGALIVLEGLDRSGKSSQCSRLVSYLEGQGISAELWRFPDRTTNVGQMISAYLSNTSQLDDHTIHLLFSANRWEKRSLMETKLKTGTTLIVDRYSYSGVAFSASKGLDIEWCKAPEIGLLAPDLVAYLDISPQKAAERGGYGDERYEKLDFQKKVAESYKTLHDVSWKVVDACQPIEDVEKQLQEIALDCVTECQKGKPLSPLLWSQ
ncbi:hypothetical protein RIF29_39118 [Crotalaria pallida]|uniref:Thymidylate kinase n=1 Tax=Crotalaria pallida TaxID=3830 RepID=A0AAN9E3M1_CROPI